MSRFDEYARLTRVLMLPAPIAFGNGRVAREWHALHFAAAPDVARATEEYAVFEELLARTGAQVDRLQDSADLTLDAIYVRDASVVSPRGMILCRMGKRTRQHEPEAHRRAFAALGIRVAGEIESPGLLEGGDVVWVDERTLLVGRGYRTNDAGIAQLTALVGPDVEVHIVHLPHHRGQDDVFHLMSILSPIDEGLAVVYSPLMPVTLREWLVDRGITLVEVPPEEFDAMGANVLAVAPRRCLMVTGAPTTRARLEAAGTEVLTYDGAEISLKGGGGPTCLTRPLLRA